VRERDENYGRQRDDLLEAKKTEIEDLDREHGRQSPNYLRLKERLGEVKVRLKDIELDVQRPLRLSLDRFGAYYWLLFVLAMVEVPVNRPAEVVLRNRTVT